MNKLITTITALTLTAGFSLATIAPASADQAAATRNEIIGGLALVAGIATAINVSNKNAEANADYGYGNGYGYRDGGDGRNAGFRGQNGWQQQRDNAHQDGNARRYAERDDRR